MKPYILPLLLISVASAADQTFFKDIAVFDGQNYQPRTCVLIESGRIKAIAPNLQAPDGSTIVKGDGHTLLPGLMDAHVHAWFPLHLKQAAEFGVTTSFDMMTQPAFVRQIKQSQKKNRADGLSDLFAAGAAVTVKGGHGTEYGFVVPVLDSADNAQPFIDERLAEGSDYIKLIYDDGKSFGVNFPTLGKDMLGASIQAAHKRGKLAVVHIGDMESARDAIELGADALMHLFADQVADDALIQLMVQKKVRVVPTMAVLKGVMTDGDIDRLVADKNLTQLLTKGDQAALRRQFPRRKGMASKYETAMANVTKMHKAGIPILVGTDSANPGTSHGMSVHHELQLLVECGLTPTNALRGATSKTADLFRLKDRGRIAPGQHADLLLVRGNPTKDITATRAIVGVWKAGAVVDLDARRDKVKNEKSDKSAASMGERLIANFDKKTLTTGFGAGIQESTDKLFGGSSTVKYVPVDGGANKSAGALKITGNVREQQPAYSGIIFYPADQLMQPADLSKLPTISFEAKGDDADFNVMVFTQKRGFTPSTKSFRAKPEWNRFTFPLSDFDGSDGSDVLGIFIGSSRPGKFELLVDELKMISK